MSGQGQLFGGEAEREQCSCCYRFDGEHTAGCVNERKRPRHSKGLSTRTQDGIERARKHANPEWIALAKSILENLARTREYFTTADVDIVMMRDFPHIKTHEKRAMGAITRWALKQNLVESTGRVVSDPRGNCNNGACYVLRSLVYVP